MRIYIFILFFVSQIHSQAPAIDWMKRYGGNFTDNFRSVEPTQDGGFFMGGWSNSGISGNKTENMIGFNFDYWVVKTNAIGDIEWQKTIGGGRSWAFGEEFGEILTVVKPTSDGGYLVGGYSDSPLIGLKTVPNYGYFDYWIIKLDALGTILWQSNLGGAGQDELSSIESTPDGGCIVGGSSSSNISGNKDENSKGGVDYWVVKLDANGQIQWQKTIGGNSSDYLGSIIVLDSNEYILGGNSSSNISGDKAENSKGGFDFWIVKIDNSGTILWQKTIGGSDNDYFSKIINTNNGFLLGGTSYSNISFDKTQNSRGDGDYWAVKTNSNGLVIWDKTFGGINLDNVLDIKKYTTNGYLLVGHSDSTISGDKTEPSFGFRDSWLLRINEEGILLWQKGLGGSENDVAYSVISMPDDSIIVGSYTASPISGNNITTSFGIIDYWLVKLDPENLDIESFNSNDFHLYPNPTKDHVNISFVNSQNNVQIIIYNSLSQKMDEFFYNNMSNITIPIHHDKSVYFIKVITDTNTTKTFKVIKN